MEHTEATTTRYFSTFSGYAIPFQPAKEIAAASLGEWETYYVGHYVGDQLVAFEKFSSGSRLWLDEYQYWPGGKRLQHRKMTKEDGSIVEQDFDRKGKVVKE
jgi:hypothetical protein